jgi:hypothetical protein
LILSTPTNYPYNVGWIIPVYANVSTDPGDPMDRSGVQASKSTTTSGLLGNLSCNGWTSNSASYSGLVYVGGSGSSIEAGKFMLVGCSSQYYATCCGLIQ